MVGVTSYGKGLSVEVDLAANCIDGGGVTCGVASTDGDRISGGQLGGIEHRYRICCGGDVDGKGSTYSREILTRIIGSV